MSPRLILPTLACIALVTLFAPGAATAQGACQGVTEPDLAWRADQHDSYTICYVQEYAHDLQFYARWLRRGTAIMRNKYGFERHHHDELLVFLHPELIPGHGLRADFQVVDGERVAIHVVTLSAPAWAERNHCCHTEALRLGRNYQAKVLVHEYVHAFQRLDYDTPRWFYEGIAEYEGIYNTTTYNSTVNHRALMAYVVAKKAPNGRRRLLVGCCQTLPPGEPMFIVDDVYNGGAFLLKFLEERVGPEIHVRLFKHGATPFDAALRDALAEAGMTVPEMFDEIAAWHPSFPPGSTGLKSATMGLGSDRIFVDLWFEPISKSFEQYQQCSKLHESEEVGRVVIPARHDAALPLEPRKEALHLPPPRIPS